MRHPLFHRLPQWSELSNEKILDNFLEYVAEKGLELYPAQEEAILELIDGKNVILNTPTGSGKSLVATALHFQSLAQGKKSYYTCPIKALVNEKFLALCQEFGPDQVGMVTGDATVNRDAPIICCTAEILANIALREGEKAKVDDVIMDEFHYYSDKQRGVAWQVPLLTLPQARFLLMSATLGEVDFFQKTLTALNDRETAVIQSAQRPVPLTFEYRETPLHETVMDLVQAGRAPVYIVNFTQRDAADEAQNLLSIDFCSKDEKKAITAALEGVKFNSPYGKEMQKLIRHGVGLHHAGILPKYRVLVERLAQKGLLKLICGTDTLGVGVNIPIRTVLFTKLCKYDGEKTAILTNRDFQQIAGRAGRKGFDDQGMVVVQAPEHEIENLRMVQKAAGDTKKLRKLVKKKPPERGYVPWTKDTFARLVNGKPEQLVSRFQISHAMLINVLSREDDGCRAMREMIRESHDRPEAKKNHRRTAWQLFRALLDRKIVEFTEPDYWAAAGMTTLSDHADASAGVADSLKRKLRVNVDLQEDFSLNQSLSLYLLDTIELLDPESETYALDLLTLVESIFESPDLILRRQLDRLKGEKIRELKEAGMEYEERMAELENLEHPKPNRDFIYDTFNEFSAKHPWVGTENIRPKSIAREMFELFMSYADYIKEYDLQRAEGILLRYLSDVYKTLAQTVPVKAKNEEVHSIEAFFGTLVRRVDSSLLDEWERMKLPEGAKLPEKTEPSSDDFFADADITRNRKAFTILVRNEVFRVLRALALRDYETVLELVEPGKELATADDAASEGPGSRWSADELTSLMKAYYQDHAWILTDPAARAPQHTAIAVSDEDGSWTIEQTITDPDDHNDWLMRLIIDVPASRAAAKPVLILKEIGPTSVYA